MLSAWQASLASLSEGFRDDTVSEVIVVRARRVLLLTKEHLVYCIARMAPDGTGSYRMLWHVRVRDVTNILSASFVLPAIC